MQIKEIPISQLISDPNNARKHDKKNIESIKGSLAKFSQQHPIIIDKNYLILAGNGRVEAMKQMGWANVKCVVSTLESITEKTAFALADNRTSELAEWDDDILKDALQGLLDDDFDVGDIGFDADDLDDIIPNEPTSGNTDDDAVPEVDDNPYNVQLGDVWQLGDHRLMCGDSTDKASVDKLMNGEKADMVFTDPPYKLTSGGTPDSSIGITLGSDTKNTGVLFDVPEPQDWLDKLPLSQNADIYVMFNDKNALLFLTEINKQKIKIHNLLVMEKSNSVPNRWYLKNCEFTFYGYVGKAKKINDMTSVSCEKIQMINGDEKVHVSQKPVEYVTNKITNSSISGGSCFDPFLGSGSTLIACEKTNRKCYGMELSEHYCSVIIQRWQDFTGKEAVKL